MHKLDLKMRIGIGWVALILLSGCAIDGVGQPKTEVPKAVLTETTGKMVLTDGRDGFIITELVKMDTAARKDFDRAVAFLNEAQYAPAIELLEKVTAQSPGVTAPYINLGMAYQRTDKLDKAESQFKTALDLMPGHPVACNQYGLLCRKSGRFAQARTLFEQALAAYPNYYPVHRNIGILCDIYLNDPESALTHYQTYSQAMPDDKKVKLWIADLKARLGVE